MYFQKGILASIVGNMHNMTCPICELLPYQSPVGVLSPAIDFLGYKCSEFKGHVIGAMR